MPPSPAINPFGIPSFENIQCILPVYSLSFDTSPGSLDSAASEEEGILHRDAAMQPQMLLLGCLSVRHCHCRHLWLIHLHRPPIEVDSNLSCLGLVASQCALQTQCVLSLVFVSRSLTSCSQRASLGLTGEWRGEWHAKKNKDCHCDNARGDYVHTNAAC